MGVVTEKRRKYAITYEIVSNDQADGTLRVEGDVTNKIFNSHATMPETVGVHTVYSDAYTAGTGTYFMISLSDSTSGTVVIDNIYVTRAGAVAEYDGSGVTPNIWYDKSGNGLDGAVSGATNENTPGFETVYETPAFLAHSASDQLNLGTLETIVFGTEVFDNANNFGSNTFTAPVTGKYHFDVSIRLEKIQMDSDYFQLRLNTSNRSSVHIYTLDPGGFDVDVNYFSATFSALTDMDKGDTAYVDISTSGDTGVMDVQSPESWFSGHLVC